MNVIEIFQKLNPEISFLFEHEPRSFIREEGKMHVEVEELKSGKRKTRVTDGIFIFTGMRPNPGLFGDELQLDQWGYMLTNEDMETSIKGAYAVGDIRSKKYRQITNAVSDGTIAAIAITKEIEK